MSETKKFNLSKKQIALGLTLIAVILGVIFPEQGKKVLEIIWAIIY